NLPLMTIGFLFFVTGFCSLSYQVAWNKILNQTVGLDYISITLVVSAFMLGLGIGSYFGSWLSTRARMPVYYFLGCELSIAGFGFFSARLLRMTPALTSVISQSSSMSAVAVDFATTEVILLIPTFLMGASLPLVTHQFRGFFPAG